MRLENEGIFCWVVEDILLPVAVVGRSVVVVVVVLAKERRGAKARVRGIVSERQKTAEKRIL